MIRLIKIVVVLALVWALWWFGAGFATRSAITGWFDEQAARGWQAEFTEMKTTGFPIWHRTRLEAPVLADPATGVAWRADWLQLDSHAAGPGRQILTFPDTDQRLSYFDQTLTLMAQDMQALLDVAPAARLQLEDLQFTSGLWALNGPDGAVLSGDTVSLTMTQGDDPSLYDIALAIPQLSLGRAVRDGLRLPDTLADRVETLELDMQVAFSRPWDISAITDSRPQPRVVRLNLAELRWGDLQFLAAGKLDINTNGTPTGEITVKAENWREMLSIAVTTGALPGDLAGPVETTLTALSRIGGNPEALDIKLTFRNGRVSAGFIPLGPAPQIFLR